MTIAQRLLGGLALLLLTTSMALAGRYEDTIALFKNAGDSADFFSKSYAYAVFPIIGEGGFIVGGAHGKGAGLRARQAGRGYDHDPAQRGLPGGGKAYSQIIFFEDKRALDEFESGSFEFAAGVSAVAVTAGASASASTMGAVSGASGGQKDATTDSGGYQKGMAVFTIAKGGLMYAAAVAGQKFTYAPRGAK